MMQFKTVALPITELKLKEKDMYTLQTANIAVAPIARVIENEAKGGWHLHSYVVIPAVIMRKKSIFENLFGWIPIINMIWANKPDSIKPQYYSLIFQREV